MINHEDTIRRKLNLSETSKVFLYRIVGILTYLNVPQHSYKLGRYLQSGDVAVISFRYITLADHDGLLALVRFMEEMEKNKIKIIIAGIKKNMERKIRNIPGVRKEFKSRTWNTLMKDEQDVENVVDGSPGNI